jgi:3-hydroxyisobutyrate dehydrogenase
MTDGTALRLSVIGLGNMGEPMARRWLAAGYEVHGCDVSEQARVRLAAAGGTAHEAAPPAVEDASVVILMLPSSAVVNDVLKGVRTRLAAGTAVIDMSSSEPEQTRENARALGEAGVALMDAPVSGGVRGAEAGTLTIMAGGPGPLVEYQRPLLECLGTVIHVGPVGAGHAVKALNNLLSATHLWATSEAVLIAERFGIAPETILSVFNASSGRSGSSEVKWPRFILPGSYDSGFAARLMLKDAAIAAKLARQTGLPSTLADAVVSLWSRAADALPPGADHTEIARWIAASGEPPSPY